MIAKEIEKFFDCKYADGVKKRTQKAPDYIFKLRATIATVTKRGRSVNPCTRVRECS